MRMAHLHCHSTYSFLDGYGTPDQLAARAAELGHAACAVTDHGNVCAHVPWQKAAAKAGVRPMFGCEFYVVDDMRERTKFNKSLGADGFPHVTVLAATQRGYENLLKLSGMSYSEGFYHKPRVDWDAIARHQDGLVVLTGCVGGYPSRLLRDKGPEAAWEFVGRRAREVERLYVELIPEPGLAISEQAMPWLMRIATDLRLPTVMTADAHFPRPEDHDVEDLMLCIGLGKKLPDADRTLRLPPYQFMCGAKELMARALDCCPAVGFDPPEGSLYQAYAAAIERSAEIADSLQAEIPKAAPLVFPGLAGRTSEKLLWDWVARGAADRKAQGLLPPEREGEYLERAAREYHAICRKGFADYILATTDIVLWAKSQGGLVMCRGSAGGCLLLWLLGCSETDSIRHDLSFERFYDDTRNDPPDIDVDFEQWMRPKVIEYIRGRFGHDKCSQIAAITLYRAKNAVVDAAKALGIPDSAVTPLTQLLDSKDDDVDRQIDGLEDPGALEVLRRHPELRIASRMVGQARQTTVHAAGMLVSSEPLDRVVGLMARPGEPVVSSVDKHGAADLNYLKMDLLAVTAFDVTAEAVRRLGRGMDWLYSLPLDDPKVYDTARRGAVTGVFQMDGAALRVAQEIGLSRFEEFYAASALCRPGPMEFVPLYRRNKYDVAAFEAYLAGLHPIAASIVRETYGVLLYQEQVMAICRRLAKMPWPQVNKLRKRISAASFNGKELGAEYGEDFVRGCRENGVGDQEIAYWWDAIKTHGVYSFNKSHCVTYGIVGYWMLYLKTHHPEVYFQTFLEVEGRAQTPNELLMKRLITEFRALGGRMVAVDLWHSKRSFSSPREGVIVGGWGNLRGIGDATARRLEAAGPFRTWDQVAALLPPSTMAALHDAGITGGPGGTCARRVAAIAPWMPVESTDPEDARVRDAWGLARPGDLGPQAEGADAVVGGYVTTKHRRGRTGAFRGEQVIYVVEDETGAVSVRCPSRLLGTLGARMKSLSLGDYVAFRGWWKGDTLFAKEFVVIRKNDTGRKQDA